MRALIRKNSDYSDELPIPEDLDYAAGSSVLQCMMPLFALLLKRRPVEPHLRKRCTSHTELLTRADVSGS
ncbi:hypothetical protein SISNIDRAFT_456259 [Sistotremastrum niveocremeum HHB9708]|uniref:Uncharacterized protein n=2 Tax=Sistotremastraceae TaxID=3402574 RepID=A0A164T3B8_9AGAM|nr:hypothetical protein SISNIDRAFT_456259 [Sistotremastrum niveocremeum HHB9708]KZT34012.1 hypothetical protein SISSUDRAFT_1053472 [Sistotremastrum suecicum HHB10207 ss-3]